MSDYDVLVVGSGIAGLSIAVRLSRVGLRVGVVTKASLSDSTTIWAQGGVAAVLGEGEDSKEAHVADTLRAGAGLCDEEAVALLVEEGPRRVEELIDLGAVFDRTDAGAFALAREGGHSHPRVLHAGGVATGIEVQRTLVDAVEGAGVDVIEHAFAHRLLTGDNGVEGIEVLRGSGQRSVVTASHIVLATGGAGQVFAVTTNPPESTGDGVAMALRAGVAVSDVEFMQFHPTALYCDISPRPLISEALRGDGALLRDGEGARFVDELAPRDVVSSAMAATMQAQARNHLWLDATTLRDFEQRFPSLTQRLASLGIHPGEDWIPVAPAAHHLAGGVMTDLSGATMLEGLWAAGEVADTGVHGANRLASNSLLEGLVFGSRVAEAIAEGQRGPSPTGVLRALLAPGSGGLGVDEVIASHDMADDEPDSDLSLLEIEKQRLALQQVMTDDAGVVRNAHGMEHAASVVGALARHQGESPATMAQGELSNLCEVARAMLAAALQRHESRGSHERQEFPERDPAWQRRLVHRGGGR